MMQSSQSGQTAIERKRGTVRILIINATTHKSSGWHAAHTLVDTLWQEDDELDEVFCPVEGIGFCQYAKCEGACLSQGIDHCPDHEAFEPLFARMDAADLLIFTTPTYCYHAPAQLMVILQHLCWRWMRHRPEPSWFGKQAVVIATAAGAGAKRPAGDIVDSLKWLGIGKTHVITAGMAAMDWELADQKKQHALEDAARKVARKIEHDPAQVKWTPSLHGRFLLMKALQKKFPTGDMDQAYWKQQGWLK